MRDERQWVRIGLGAVGFAAVAAITYLIAHPRMYTGFGAYDDEGYMLTALQSFLDGGGLYDEVFTQYGPFYYEAWGALFSLFGIPVTHDGGRAVTVAAWVIAPLALGLATARMTGSILLGLLTQVLVFSSIGTLSSEPMHPGGIVCLLLAAIIAVSCWMRGKTSVGAAALLGASVAALILVKINVGVFAFAALALVCVVTYDPLRSRRWLRPVVEGVFVLIPFALMASKLGESWVREYAFHVSAAALAVVLVLRARSAPRRNSEELAWMVGGGVALALVSCVAVLTAGTSPSGLFDGLVGQPLRQSDAFSMPFGISNRILVFDLVALVGAAAYLYVARGREGAVPGGGAIVAVVSILVGIELALSPTGRTVPFEATGLLGFQLSLLAFAWVALIPPRAGGEGPAAFARLLIVPLAVLQALHAYPVAGSQVLWSSFLLVPVGALCVIDGVRTLGALSAERGDGRERRALIAAGAVLAGVLAIAVLNWNLREPLRDVRAAYDGGVPLNLPGAREVRLGQEEAELYRAVSRAIDQNCAAFAMLPGMNSFYIWTDQVPPTGLNATGWPTLFDDERQRQAIADIDPQPGLCLLENEALAGFWSAGAPQSGPLVEYMRREFRPLLEIGDYKLKVRKGEDESA